MSWYLIKSDILHKSFFIAIMLCLVTLITCTKTDAPVCPSGMVTFNSGTASVERDGKQIELKNGLEIKEGDVVRTGSDSVVVVSFGDIANAEIQSGSAFSINDLNKQGVLELSRGNVWFQVKKKLARLNSFILKTPTSLAAVRGTKMYAYQSGDIFITCHCEGDVEFMSRDGKYKKTHHRDFLTFSSKNGTIALLPDELRALGMKEFRHDHSEIDGSPLGNKKVSIPADMLKKIMALAEKKMKG